MSEISKQDLQTVVQQSRDTILDRMPTRNDLQVLQTAVVQRINRGDLVSAVDQMGSKITTVIREQQGLVRNLSEQVSKLTTLVIEQDYKIKNIEHNLKDRPTLGGNEYYELQRKMFDKLYAT
jgi:hypothetical protein